MRKKDRQGGGRAGRFRQAAPLALFVLVVAVYAPAASFEFIYDDHVLILDEPAPQSLGDVWLVFAQPVSEGLPYYRPLPRLSTVVQDYLFGRRAAAFHLFNVLAIGGFAAATYWLFLAPRFELPNWVAFAGAALAALHPAASCTVYPICSGRETLLPALFIVAAARCYLGAGWISYLAALLFFVLGLLSKEQAVVVPGIFVLADFLELSARGRPQSLPAWLRRHAAPAAILVAYLLLRREIVSGHELDIALLSRPFGPLLSVVYALQTACAPFVQLVYEPSVDAWVSSGRALAGIIAVMLLTAGAFPRWPAVRSRFLFWLAWAALMLLPTANILDQETRFAERYVFLSLVGVIGMCATVVSSLPARAAPWSRAAVIVVLLACAAVSVHRGRYYQEDLVFHRQWVATSPESAQARRSLGWVLLERGEIDEAEEHLRRALALDPSHAEVYSNLGNVLLARGQPVAAAEQYQRALGIDAQYAPAHYNLATLLASHGQSELAERHFQEAIAAQTNYADAYNGLGCLLIERNRWDEAEAQLKQAIRLDPSNAEAYNNLGYLNMLQGAYDRAVQSFQEALRLRPDYDKARSNLQEALAKQGGS